MKNEIAFARENNSDCVPVDSESALNRAFPETALHRFSSACLRKLHALKERLASNLASEFAGVVSPAAIRLAVNEADSLAATTPFPALFLPALAEEKARAASQWQARQRQIRSRSWAFAE